MTLTKFWFTFYDAEQQYNNIGQWIVFVVLIGKIVQIVISMIKLIHLLQMLITKLVYIKEM